MTDARHILEQSLDMIRAKLNLTPTSADYTLVSQESLVMYLLQAVQQSSILAASDQSDARRQRREFRERWHVLKQYKCDPWQEIETFEHKLQHLSATQSDVTERPTFDIGRSAQTHHMGAWNEEALSAYNFLRFCEDVGVPFRVSHCTIATKSAAGTLKRIGKYSSYWALATLVRINDTKAVDEIFDRVSLARMSTASVDSLINRYLESLRLAVPDIATGDRRRDANFGTLLAGILPEILSRLCVKCSGGARNSLLEWLLEIYRDEHRSNYQGIRELMQRLLETSPVVERVAMVPQLLQFPILANLDAIEAHEYVNPFDVIDLHEESLLNGVEIPEMLLGGFFDGAYSARPSMRRWAISTLGMLHAVGLLDHAASQRFGDALWSRVDDLGLPSDTNYYRFAFLSLPHPTNVDPVERFIRYVRAARFPAQESHTQTTIGIGANDRVPLCQDICGARDIQWSKDDVHSIVHRLVQWWDADKAHWRRAQGKGLLAAELGKRLADLLMTLVTIVGRYPDSVRDEATRTAISRVADECSEYGVPVLRLEVAYSYVFRASRESVLKRVKEAMASPRTNVVIDALEAMDMVSHRTGSELDGDDLMQLLHAAGQMIRWRRDTALWVTMDAVGTVVKRHPWVFVDEIENGVLTGLGHLMTETVVGMESGPGFRRNAGFQDVSKKLVVRRTAARLAYRLFEHYRARDEAIPEAIEAWATVCRSDDEFLEIRNKWLR